MKKEALVILTLAFLILPLVSATDVAYIYRKNFRIDNNILDAFHNMNLTVDLINERNLPADFSQYKFIFVGDENFRNRNRIPVNDFPSVVINYYHTENWGLTDTDGASLLAANYPLSVIQNNQLIQVYTLPFGRGGTSLPYYYLDLNNRAPSMETIASVETTSSGSQYGDVISHADAGDQLLNGITQNAKMCYFGLVKSGVWTAAAREMFAECVGFVSAECETDNDCPADEFTEPFCDGDNLVRTRTEFMCEEINSVPTCVSDDDDVIVEECEFGCSNGACNEPPEIECNENSDCGLDGFVDEPFCFEGNATRTFRTFTCHNPGTENSFCSSSTENRLIEICSEICVDGECVDDGIECSSDEECDDNNPLTFDECINPGTQASDCRNTPINCASNADCGFTGFFGEEFCSEDTVEKNFQTAACLNPGTTNSSCLIQITQEEIQECQFACFEGACIRCDENLDCDDDDASTNDVCHLSGTLESFCTNIQQQIECTTNSDCGENGFIEEPFCTGDNVTRLFETFTCNNPGNENSFCSSEISQVNVQECQFACFDGSCIRCDENFDCDDGNTNTEDICHNSGTPESFCTNEPIICFTNSDCGEDGFSGEPFCSNNNLSRIFVRNICNNPGNENSFCSTENETVVIEECAFGCENNMCVEEGVHDIALIDFSGSVDRIRIEYQNGTDIFGNELMCNEKYKISVTARNLGTQTEDVTFNSFVDGIDFDHNDIFDLQPQETSLRTKTVNFTLAEGFYNITVESSIVGFADANPIDNIAHREIFVMCGAPPIIECFSNIDCGVEGFVDEPFCVENNRSENFVIPTCNNPGMENSFCTNQTEVRTIEVCSEFCLDGECVNVECSTDAECGTDDFVEPPFCTDRNVTRLFQDFTCNNPGMENSFCSSTTTPVVLEICEDACINGMCVEIMCRASSECGADDFVGQPFCVGDDVYQNFTEHTCLNPGSANSVCDSRTHPELRQECPFACFDGECIRCNENLDCNDNNQNTNDVCLNSGQANSECRNDPIIFQCDDRIDNDNDGFIDFPADPGCSSRIDNSELPVNLHQCNNGIDDDGDSFIDFPNDAGCSNPFDNTEYPVNVAQCDDGVDNDNDGRIDYPADTQCSNRLDNSE